MQFCTLELKSIITKIESKKMFSRNLKVLNEGMYMDFMCSIHVLQIRFVGSLFVNFHVIRYGNTIEQTTCTFSRANDLASHALGIIITMLRIKRENVDVVCSTVSP